MGVVGDFCVARRQRCPNIASSSLLDLTSKDPSVNIVVLMKRGTEQGRLISDPAPSQKQRDFPAFAGAEFRPQPAEFFLEGA